MHRVYERRCVACRQQKLKQEMIRVCRVDDKYVIDTTYKLNGRSAYVCNDNQCIKKTIDKKLLNRTFKTNLEDIYINLRGYVE